MKSRILYTLLALYAITITAQTNVTSLVKNYSFENGLANWTNDGFQTQNNTAFTLKAGEWYAEKWVPEGGTVTNASLIQNIKITSAGTYTLTARAQNIQQASPSLVCKGVKLFIGDMSVDVNTAGTYSVTFTAVGSAVKLGLMVTSATGNWIAADHFMLSYTYDADKVNTQLQAEIDVARQLQNDANGSHSAKEALQQAIDAAASYINATSADGITDIVDKLQAAEYACKERSP